MKKTLVLLPLLLVFGSVAFGATEFKISEIQEPIKNCAVTVPYTVYGGKTDKWTLFDTLRGDKNTNFRILFEETYGRYYNPYKVLGFSNDARLGFRFRSHIKPAGEEEVIVLGQNEDSKTNFLSPITVNGSKPSRTTIAGQFVFYVMRQQESAGKGAAQEYKYMPANTNPWVQKSISLKTLFNGAKNTESECLNYYVGRCGDGIVDNGPVNASGFAEPIKGVATSNGQLAGGEQCDDGIDNGKPGKCSATCTTGTGTTAICGNGIVEGTEQCDNGTLNGTAGNSCSSTCTTSTAGSLSITKSLITNKSYFSGDTVEFRIDFRNNSSLVANSVVLQDALPNSLQYLSSELSISGATLSTAIEQNQFVVYYTKFNLQPGQAGYMIIRAKLQVSYEQCMAMKTNRTYIDAQGFSRQAAQAEMTCGQNTISVNPTCLSISTPSTSTSKTIHVSCVGSGTTTTTPASINCGNGNILPGVTDSMGIFSQTCSYNSVSEAQRAKISCGIGNDTNNSACKRTFNACTIEADSIVAIINEEDEDNNDNNEVRYTCRTSDGSERSLKIDCGNGDDSGSETDSSISYTCKYNKDDYDDAGKDKLVQARCIVDNTPSCSVEIALDRGMFGICGNNIREGYEQCDAGGPNGAGIDEDGRTCLEGCTCATCNDNVTQCLSVANSNTSIQDKEILPFWWRMYHADALADDKVRCNWDNYNQFKGVLVNRDSMTCDFSLRQPGQDKPVTFLKGVDCDKKQFGNNPLFSNFYPEFWKYAFGTFYVEREDLIKANAIKSNTFGEYKIRLHEVDYKYCYCVDEDNCDWQDTKIKNVCETDFVITKPYLIQKSAFGSIPRVADAKLTNFYDIKGDALINKTDMSDVMILNGSDYQGGAKAEKLIINEANKISKLAVKVDPSTYTSKELKQNGMIVKKVPNKLIYFIEGKKGQEVNLSQIAKFTTPFTIITKNINLIIEGSMDTNGMFVVQNGNIQFKESTDPAIRCSAPQIVRGIFVTDKDFTTTKLENTSLNSKWCSYGNLHVKGILIGNGLDQLVQNRRSNLNQWFKVSGSAKSQQVQRRNQIFNGASLLIEYNPDLWKQLPPGADQFVNLLDIYKK